jgi:hypothetical protein
MMMMMMMKQMVYAGSGAGEKKEGDGVDATSEYCAEASLGPIPLVLSGFESEVEKVM